MVNQPQRMNEWPSNCFRIPRRQRGKICDFTMSVFGCNVDNLSCLKDDLEMQKKALKAGLKSFKKDKNAFKHEKLKS